MRGRHLALVSLVVLASRGSAQDGRLVAFDRYGYRLDSIGQTVAPKVGKLDASRGPVPNATIVWRIDHPAIATVSRRGIVKARAIGYTRLWAVVGGDSAWAIILVKGSRGTINGTGASIQRSTGEAVRFRARGENSVGALVAAADTLRVSVLPSLVASVRLDTITAPPLVTSRTAMPGVLSGASEVRDSAAAAAEHLTARRLAGRLFSVTANASHTTHSARLAPGISERRAGLLAGGTASIAPSATWLASADFRIGTLAGGETLDGDLKVTEAAGQFTYWSARWLGVRGGYTLRSESANLVLHRWQFINIGALSRLAFREGAITSVTALSLLPWGRFSGYVDNTGRQVATSKTSLAFETGLEFDPGQMRAGIIYSTERFAFPELNGTARRDRVSTLRLRVGIQTGPWNQPKPHR